MAPKDENTVIGSLRNMKWATLIAGITVAGSVLFGVVKGTALATKILVTVEDLKVKQEKFELKYDLHESDYQNWKSGVDLKLMHYQDVIEDNEEVKVNGKRVRTIR